MIQKRHSVSRDLEWVSVCRLLCTVMSLSNIEKTKVLMTNGSLMKVESIAECSPWNILQYFWFVLSNNWSWKPNFGLFESGCFRQVLLYVYEMGMLVIPAHWKLYGPWREKTCLRWFANNKGAPQPAHLRSLIRTFVIRLLESIISKLATSKFLFF